MRQGFWARQRWNLGERLAAIDWLAPFVLNHEWQSSVRGKCIWVNRINGHVVVRP